MLNAVRKKLRRKWIEKILISLGKHFPIVKTFVPPRELYLPNTHRTISRGGVNFHVDLNDEIGHSLYFLNHCKVTEQFLKLIKSHWTVIDVGAQFGSSALLAAAVTKSGSVYAYESNPEKFKELDYNIGLNQFRNIFAIKKAVGKTIHKAQMTGAEVTTLDQEFVRLKQDHVDIIRIDALGFELNVLLGAKTILEKFHPILMIRFDDKSLKNSGRNAIEVIHFVKQLGYSCIDLNTSLPLVTGLKTETIVLCYI